MKGNLMAYRRSRRSRGRTTRRSRRSARRRFGPIKIGTRL